MAPTAALASSSRWSKPKSSTARVRERYWPATRKVRWQSTSRWTTYGSRDPGAGADPLCEMPLLNLLADGCSASVAQERRPCVVSRSPFGQFSLSLPLLALEPRGLVDVCAGFDLSKHQVERVLEPLPARVSPGSATTGRVTAVERRQLDAEPAIRRVVVVGRALPGVPFPPPQLGSCRDVGLAVHLLHDADRVVVVATPDGNAWTAGRDDGVPTPFRLREQRLQQPQCPRERRTTHAQFDRCSTPDPKATGVVERQPTHCGPGRSHDRVGPGKPQWNRHGL